MPIYTYRCKECQHEFDLIQKITDDKFEKYHCKKCDKEVEVSRLIGNTSFRLNGRG